MAVFSEERCGRKDGIAVIGMSCRFPGANSTEEFMEFLCSGQNGISPTPLDRPYLPANLRAGFLKCPIDSFDAKFYGLSRREAELLDPQQRLLLELTWEALEKSGINPLSLRGRSGIGIFTGIWEQDYAQILTNLRTEEEFHRIWLCNALSTASARIAHLLGLSEGHSLSIEGACASSAIALHYACESLRKEETNLAIASGVNLILTNQHTGTTSTIFAKDFRCKTFDACADGYARSEGCGVVVLKRLKDALRNRDPILGIIIGSAKNTTGGDSGLSFGTPNPMSQAQVFSKALKMAGVSPNQVSYLEAHGTGTIVGDPAEMSAIQSVYGTGSRSVPLLIGSLKTNIGHTEAAAGIASLIKLLLCFESKLLPPHLHLNKLNPKINIEAIPAQITTTLTKYDGKYPRIAAFNTFGMSGLNVHFIVQEPPPQINLSVQPPITPTPFPIILSAKSESSLDSLKQKYLIWLENDGKTNDCSMGDMTYTLCMGRPSFKYRLAVSSAKDKMELMAKLKDPELHLRNNGKSPSKIAFLFPGQGSQYFEMGKVLYDANSAFREEFQICDDSYQQHLAISLKSVLWECPDLLTSTLYCQPAIFCFQVALTRFWERLGVRPDLVLGHSLGEFAAAVSAGILTFEDGMVYVVGRSRLVSTLPPGAMLAVKAEKDVVNSNITEFIKDENKWIDIAALNSKTQTVVSGPLETIMSFMDFLSRRGIKSSRVLTAHSYHSRALDPILLDYYRLLSTTATKNPSPFITYISGLTGSEMTCGFDPNYWCDQMRKPVNFMEACKRISTKTHFLLEIGSKPVLLGLIMENNRDSSIPHMMSPSMRSNEDNCVSILSAIGKLYVNGMDLNWMEWFGSPHFYKRIQLPTYAFDQKRYWVEGEVKGEKNGSEIGFEGPLIPFLGRQFINGSIRDHHFICKMSLNQPEYKFLKDHEIGGEIIIFPASLFIEIMRVIGKMLYSDGVLLRLDNMAIPSALTFLKNEAEIQTVITPHIPSPDDRGRKKLSLAYKIEISKFNVKGHQKKKRLYAIGSIGQLDPKEQSPRVNIPQIKSGLMTQIHSEWIYTTFEKLGYTFGSTFQPIESAWYSDQNTIEVLTRMTPSSHPTSSKDAMVIEFMIQSVVLANMKFIGLDKLAIPIKVNQIIWFQDPMEVQFYYTHVLWSNHRDAKLYSRDGVLLALIEGLQFHLISSQVFCTALTEVDGNVDKKPLTSVTSGVEYYKEVWVQHQKLDKAVHRKNMDEFRAVQDFDDEFEELVNELCFYHLIAATHKTGLDLKCHDWSISMDKWVTTLSPAIQNLKVKDVFIHIFKYHTNKEEFNSRRLQLPDLELCYLKIKKLTDVILGRWKEEEDLLNYLNSFGSSLPDILQGHVSVLSILFPEFESEFGLGNIYKSKLMAHHYIQTSQIIANVTNDITCTQFQKSPQIRILEIGGGSGACTEQILKIKQNSNLNIEYTFTDISKLFLQRAKVKFGSSVDTYQVLDIEQDPLTQGFPPFHYDIVIAMNVVHATQSIRDSIQNIKRLLKDDGGVLVLVELQGPPLFLSMLVGLTDGWSRYTDTDLRPNSPLLSMDEWNSVLISSGFKISTTVQNMNHMASFIGVTETRIKIPTPSIHHTWLLIGQDQKQDGCQYLIHKFHSVERRLMILNGSEWEKVYRDDGVTEFLGSINNLEGILYWPDMSINDMNFDIERQCRGLLGLTQGVIELDHGSKKKVLVLLLTEDGIGPIEEAVELKDSNFNPGHSTLHSFFKSFKNERNNPNTYSIDFENRRKHDEICLEQLFELFWMRDSEFIKLLRNEKIFVPRWVPLPITNDAIPPTDENDQRPLFKSNRTYLITGGFGGIGLEVLKWMIQNGVQFIVVTGRKPLTSYPIAIPGRVRIEYIQGDIGQYSTCSNILEVISNQWPPLSGIFHCAGTLADSRIINQSWENWSLPLKAKVHGSWYLHTLSNKLDYFVMFSSLASVFGVEIQSNHAAACGFQDSLAIYRRQKGLCGTSINWGYWSDVGVVGNTELGERGSFGIKPFSSSNGIQALELILRQNILQSHVVGQGTNFELLSKSLRHGNYLDLIHWTNPKEIEIEMKVDGREMSLVDIQAHVEQSVRKTLKLSPTEEIENEQILSEIGMDSLLRTELRSRLVDLFGERVRSLDMSSMSDNDSIHELAGHIQKLLRDDGEWDGNNSNVIDWMNLAIQDAILPPDIHCQGNEPCKSPSDWKNILLIGATGFAGQNILSQILVDQPHINVVCLIRSKTLDGAIESFKSAQSRYQFQHDMKRIRIIVGDVTSEFLGLRDGEEEYKELGKKIDGVINCSGFINHLIGYTEGGVKSIRAQNVLGLINILRFLVSSQKTKGFLHISTIVASTELDAQGFLKDDFPDIPVDVGIQFHTSAFLQSKFIGEKLIGLAYARGVPVILLRCPTFFGNQSKNGHFPMLKARHFSAILLASFQLKVYPEMFRDEITLIPIDVAAKIATLLFFGNGIDGGVYNLTYPSMPTTTDFLMASKSFGVELKRCPMIQWTKMVSQSPIASNIMAPFKQIWGEDDSMWLTSHAYRINRLYAELLSAKLNEASEKLMRNVPNLNQITVPGQLVLQHHLQYIQRQRPEWFENKMTD